jgi:tetratricopeptide (TPR) repeat protein
MAGMTKLFGDLSAEVVQVCATLSTLHEQQGQYKKAVAILVRVLKAQESSLGESARMTLNTVSNLAGLLSHVGDLQQAKDMYIRAAMGLAVLARAAHGGVEGSEDKDLDLLCCLGNQAILMEKLGDQDGALALCKRALRGKVALLGKRHAETLRSFNNLACMLEALGQNEEAYEMFEQCFEGRKATLSPTHPETLQSESACANILLKQGKTSEAVTMYENVVAAFAAEVGAASPLFIKALQELGFARMQNDDLENALSCYKQVTNLKLKKYGGGHPGTLKAFFDTGLLLAQMDDVVAAKKMLNAAKEGYSEAGTGFEQQLQKTSMIIAMLEQDDGDEGGPANA